MPFNKRWQYPRSPAMVLTPAQVAGRDPEKWYRQWLDPIRRTRATDFPFISYDYFVASAENITLDKWYKLLSEPQVKKQYPTTSPDIAFVFAPQTSTPFTVPVLDCNLTIMANRMVSA